MANLSVHKYFFRMLAFGFLKSGRITSIFSYDYGFVFRWGMAGTFFKGEVKNTFAFKTYFESYPLKT